MLKHTIILFLTISLAHKQSFFCASLRISYNEESSGESIKFIYPKNNKPESNEDEDSPNYLIYSKSLNLTCEAEEPIEWAYSGAGSPSKVVETSRRTEDDRIVSQLRFEISTNKSRDYAQHTGSYTCRSLQNSTTQATVYVYFPGKGDKLFLTRAHETPVSGLLTPEILYLPDCTEQQLAGSKDYDKNCSYDFVIPCLSTDPSVNVSLFRKYDHAEKVEPVNDAQFDSRIGFTLPSTNSSSNGSTVNLIGEYMCIAQTVGQENRTFFVYPTRSVKTTPSESNVYVGKVLNLTCEFHEPVVIKEIQSYVNPSYIDEEEEVADDEIEETTETIPLNKHVANYIDVNPIPGSYGEFQCLTENELKTVLHSWKYFVIGKEADEKSGIKYSKSKKSFHCRSKTNQPGQLSFVNCENPSECQINRVCLEKSNSCRGYKNPSRKPHNHCTKSTTKLCHELLHFGGSGFVKCTGEGIDQIKKFSPLGLRLKEKNKKKKNNSSTYGEEPTLNLTLSSNGRFKATLKRSNFHFVNGEKWLLKTCSVSDGEDSHSVIHPESEKVVEKHLTEYQFEIVNATGLTPLELSCTIPLRQSMNWTTVTVPFPKFVIPPPASSASTYHVVVLNDGRADVGATVSDDKEEMTTTKLGFNS